MLTTKQRAISFLEVLLGAAIVIGHNVFHKIPNEVPILFVLFWLSFGLRERGYAFTGLRRPASWTKTILYAIGAVILLHVGSELVIQPLAHRIWPAPEKISNVIHTSPTWKESLTFLGIVWTFAAFGEEFSYRGYLLNRAADLGNRSKLSYVLAMIYVAVLFGFGHWYKGPAGVVDSTWSGLVIGTAYLLSGRNLWTAVLAHGLSDTVAVVAYAMGWAN
ncbi:Abortive infection protein [Candidatus Koribacter versatilis Ellin345]|uniref:Abortive infection protein n=1 Tax=Koribacter versatilis (strain Ellin345) TaxID=204669 RepID=Q1II80_KORVE|nr:CPBP family intramembrane glutamic endopeptidase [Candidatus Koribacter versatilis]ABF43420.1 Abortive infection protein [Candidatus Koribacter versatilis Ellin345]